MELNNPTKGQIVQLKYINSSELLPWVNGQQQFSFPSLRDLLQGDLLSDHHFVLMMKVLSCKNLIL